ncbi:MAG: hypothetical protein HYY25_08315 [Candidatus Wallbacteria bacterium]|nr:hypothetical protein [Candidatus Wallbacteria bacterium]MBI4867085.1 hypothetical protein [Candidatus Wallbacteria bacterium]
MAQKKDASRPVELTPYETKLAGRHPDVEEAIDTLDPIEAVSFRQTLRLALGHADARLARLAADAISRARACHTLFEVSDLPRLRKAAEAGDAANRLYATALLLALSGFRWHVEEEEQLQAA